MRIPYTACFSDVQIRPLEEDDLESLRNWRNDRENTKYLRSIGEITSQMQQTWFKESLQDETSYVFAVDCLAGDAGLVGSLAIYDIKGDTAEIGKMLIGPNARGKKIGFNSMNLALHIGFQKLGMERFLLEVHEDNLPAKMNYLHNGFEVCGDHAFFQGGREWDMVLTKERFYRLHQDTSDYVIREI